MLSIVFSSLKFVRCDRITYIWKKLFSFYPFPLKYRSYQSSYLNVIKKDNHEVLQCQYISLFCLVLGPQTQQQCYSTSSTHATDSGSIIFTNGFKKASLGIPKSSLQTEELIFGKHLTSAGTLAGEPFSSGSNRISAISGKRNSDFTTSSLASGNNNNQPETAPAMLLVHSQQVSTDFIVLRHCLSITILFAKNPDKNYESQYLMKLVFCLLSWYGNRFLKPLHPQNEKLRHHN